MEHRARKRFGQNFLHDQNVIGLIVNSLGPLPGQSLVEIGPGLGALTEHVLPRCKALTCIELDRDVIPLLQRKCEGLGELNIISADAMKIDLATLGLPAPLRVYGNLPYNISTPLLFHLFDSIATISDMLFMLQKEVVERMASTPKDDAYGRLSVMVQYYCQVDYLFTVPPGAFNPAPKVYSAIVRLQPHAKRALDPKDEKTFGKIVTAAFSARRKTLRNALKTTMSVEQIAAANIDVNLRPENLSVADYVRLTQAYLQGVSQ